MGFVELLFEVFCRSFVFFLYGIRKVWNEKDNGLKFVRWMMYLIDKCYDKVM